MSASRSIARNTAVRVAGEALSKLASLALYVVMARTLGREGFGDFMFSLSLAILLTVFAGFGIDSVIVRDVARAPEIARRLLADALAVKVLFGALGIGAATLVAVVGGYSGAVQLSVALLATAAVIDMVARNFFSVLQGMDDMAPQAVGLILQRTVTAAAGIVLLALGAGIVTVSVIWLGGSLLALAYSVWVMRRRALIPERRSSPERVKQLVAASFSIGLAGIFSTVLFRVDSTMLSFLQDNEAVGLYGVAYRLLESTLFLSFAFVGALLPTLARLNPHTTPPVAQAFELGCKVLAVGLVPLGVGFICFAHPVVTVLYGSEYEAAVTATRILGGAVMLYGLSYLGGYVIISQGRQRILPWIVAGVAVENIALNLVLIPWLSYDGAAISTTVCEATHAALMLGFAIRAAGAVSTVRILLGPAVGAAAMGGAAVLLGDGALGIAAGALGYIVGLVVVERRVFPEDLGLVFRTLARRGASAHGATA